MTNAFNATYDTATLLKDAGAVTADAAAQVGGSNQILDLGAGQLRAEPIVDVSAITVGVGDELYSLILQGSSTPDFSGDIHELAVVRFGDASSAFTESADSGSGRHMVPVTNRPKGSALRYVRLFTDVTGASPSIDYTARLSKLG